MREHAWIRRRSNSKGIDWAFVAYWTFSVLFILSASKWLVEVALYYVVAPQDLFADAGLYYRATEAWLSGGNPWLVTREHGVPFAGPPTTLLLNLPLQPFGTEAARCFWPVAGIAGWLFAMRRLRLPPWWLGFPPFVEALLAGSPDPALMGLVVAGGGAVAALAKPYSVPSMAAERRWRALIIAAALLVVTALILPWMLFVEELDRIQVAFATWSIHSSAWGDPVLMAATIVALVAMGPRLGLLLATPGLWPGAQLHYSIFSARVGALSPFLGLALAIPGAAPYGIVAYATVTRLGPRILPRPFVARFMHAHDDPVA